MGGINRVRSGTICEFSSGKDAAESVLRMAGPFECSVTISSSGVVTMMEIGIAVDLSNSVEVLEIEDFRVLTGGVFSGEVGRCERSVGES